MNKSTVQPMGDPDELIKAYEFDLNIREQTPHSIESYMSNLRIFKGYLDDKNITFTEVDRSVLIDFIQYLRKERNVKGKTIKYYFSALNSFFKYLQWEQMIVINPVPEVAERYVRRAKKQDLPVEKRLLSVEELAILAHSILDPRDKAVLVLLAKTGIRRDEMISIDVDDVDRANLSIRLKHHRKRTNHVVFFDDETNRVLGAWLTERERLGCDPDSGPLFVNQYRTRLQRNGIYAAVTKWAKQMGYHNPKSKRMQDRFGPHCCRHWFTTHLRRAEMSREFRAWLRGDVLRDAQDIYDHIDPEEVREDYLKRIPQLGF